MLAFGGYPLPVIAYHAWMWDDKKIAEHIRIHVFDD
jgi:hypothetical protein